MAILSVVISAIGAIIILSAMLINIIKGNNDSISLLCMFIIGTVCYALGFILLFSINPN